MKYNIFSTLSADNIYVAFEKGQNGAQNKKAKVLIKGGANIADKKTLETPKVILNILEEAQYEAIKDVPLFKQHVQNGYLEVVSKRGEAESVRGEAESVAKDMTGEDASAPETADKINRKSKAKVRE